MTSSYHLSHERYVAALQRLRAIVAGGAPLKFFDCTDLGAKDTQCSWGMCSRQPALWPDAQDHLWPDQFERHGRIAPKYRAAGQLCPMDRATTGPAEGCFYRCRVFKPAGGRPTRAQTLEFIDMRLDAAKEPF